MNNILYTWTLPLTRQSHTCNNNSYFYSYSLPHVMIILAKVITIVLKSCSKFKHVTLFLKTENALIYVSFGKGLLSPICCFFQQKHPSSYLRLSVNYGEMFIYIYSFGYFNFYLQHFKSF